tara:strand:- start:2734 stop:3477 length:744 start_codon:yes stop_codon:yes gene_type:complete
MLYSKNNIMDLSVILPCYNENKNIEGIINQLTNLNFRNIKYEIIFVDNGSTDNSFKNFHIHQKKFNLGIIKVVKIKKNLGYGNGIIRGIKQANGKIISWTHADLQTDIHDIFEGYYKLISYSSNDKVILKGKRINRNFVDSFFTYCMSIYVKIFLNINIEDINAQPKMFYKSFLPNFENPPNDFSLDLFFLILAKKNKYKIIEQNVYFKTRKYGIAKGGGNLYGKIKLIIRTIKYINLLKNNKKLWK